MQKNTQGKGQVSPVEKVRLRVSAMINSPRAQAERRASIWKAQGIRKRPGSRCWRSWPKPMDSRCRWGRMEWLRSPGRRETRRALKWSMGLNWCRSRTWWFSAFTRRGRRLRSSPCAQLPPKLDAKPAGRGTQADSGCGVRRGRTALYRAQRPDSAVICSVLSREEGQGGSKRLRRGRLRRGLVLSVLCLQGRLNVSNARLM